MYGSRLSSECTFSTLAYVCTALERQITYKIAGKHYSIDSLFRCIEQSRKEEYFCINFSADLAIKIFTFIYLYILIPLLHGRELVQCRSPTWLWLAVAMPSLLLHWPLGAAFLSSLPYLQSIVRVGFMTPVPGQLSVSRQRNPALWTCSD